MVSHTITYLVSNQLTHDKDFLTIEIIREKERKSIVTEILVFASTPHLLGV